MRKKKIRLLALLLAFSMVLSVIPMPVLAEGTETHVHNDSGTAVTFTTAWTSNNSLPASAGSYYLTEDVSISGTWTVPTGTTTNLDLNGHSIIMTGAQTVIKVSGSSTVFNLYDCQGTGKITGGRGNRSTSGSSAGGVAVKGSSIFNMYGGNITGNDAGANGFGGGIMIYSTSSVFNMYGGAISDNTAYQSGGVQNQGKFNMYGGTISGNTGTHSVGGVCNYDGSSMTMSGNASVKNNTGKEFSGGIALNEGVKLTMSGNASVEGNTTEGGGGGIYNYGGIVTMSDSVSVKNNCAGYSGGGILNISASGEVIISGNVSVVGNSTEGFGGGITNSGGSVKISDNVLIEENTATTFGGGIYNAGTMEMSGSANITKNSSDQYGAGIFNFGTVKLTDNASVVGNTTETYGGGIFNFQTLILGGAINISDNIAGDEASNLVLAERGYEDSDGTYNQVTDYRVTVESPLTNTTPIGVSVWNVGQAPMDIKIEEFDTGSDSVNDEVKGIGVDEQEVIGGWVVTGDGYKNNNDGDEADKYFTSEDPNRILLISKGGEVYLVLHTHTWTYNANGDTVSAKCTKDDNLNCNYKKDGITLKIEAEDMTYTGNPHDGANVTNNITAVTGAESGNIYYEGTGSTSYPKSITPPTEIGTYKATVVIGGATAETEFEIVKEAVYIVTYVADGKIIATKEVKPGEDVKEVPEIPSKEGYDKVAPTWDNDGKNITGDTTIIAIYTKNEPENNQDETPKDNVGGTLDKEEVYTVTYVADGKVIATEKVKSGEDVKDIPEIPSKVGYDKTAPTWDNDGKNIAQDITINAIYTKNAPGKYEDKTPDDNVGGGKLDNDMDELKDSLPFTTEELEKIENGADVDIWFELKDITDGLTDEEKKIFEEEFPDLNIPLYMDPSIFKQIGDDPATEITDLNDKINIKVTVPDEYINTDDSVDRTYQVIGINDGKAEMLDSDYDEDTQTLTIETDVIVLIALAYFDSPADALQTADNSNTWNWIALMSVGGMGIVVSTVYSSKKKRQRVY